MFIFYDIINLALFNFNVLWEENIKNINNNLRILIVLQKIS